MTRAIELTAIRQFRLTEHPSAGPAPGAVEVRVAAVGICGSDLHSYAEGAIGETEARYPMILGHEPAGVVSRVGEGVTGWNAGDRVAVEPALCCYHCEFCMAGHHNVCQRIRFMSQPGCPGFLRDYVTVPAENLIPLDPSTGLAEGTLIEPLAIALHSMNLANPRPGETAVVFGAGPIGLMTAASLRLHGLTRIWIVDPLPHRLRIARTLGIDAGLARDADPVAEVLRATGGRGVDLAVDCATRDDTVNEAIRVTRNAGRVLITGIPSTVTVPIDFHRWRRKELAVQQVRRSNHESGLARDLLAREPRRFVPAITHQRPLEETPEAFDQLEHYRDGVGKLVIRLDGG